MSACIGSNTPAAAPPSGASAPSATAASDAPSLAPAPSSAPSSEAPETAAPTTTATPTAETSAGASPSDDAAAVDGCTGNDDNRTFLANAAERYDWPVYCAALPARWFVGTGSFGSGKLEISYKGPDGARFELHEGAVCAAGVDCFPTGTDLGTTGFGDQLATIIRVEDGGLAASVDRGRRLSWLAIGQGMDEAAFRSILGALIRLD